MAGMSKKALLALLLGALLATAALADSETDALGSDEPDDDDMGGGDDEGMGGMGGMGGGMGGMGGMPGMPGGMGGGDDYGGDDCE
jgi:hypothetical protein